MNIIKRIWLIPTFSSILFVLFLGGVVAIIGFSNSASEKLLRVSDDFQPILNKVTEIRYLAESITELLEDAVTANEEDFIKDAERSRGHLDHTVEILAKIDPERGNSLSVLLARYLQSAFHLSRNMLDGDTSALGVEISEVAVARAELYDFLSLYEDLVNSELRNTVEATRDEIQDSTLFISIFVGTLATLLGLGTFLVVRSTSHQLQGLMDFAKEVEKGNYNFKVDSATKSEFSSLVEALDSMVKSIRSSTEQLNHMAHYDSLSGVPNRRAVMDRLHSEVKSVKRHGYDMTFCMCDIDKFKGVNDDYGHLTGDLVVKEFANILKEQVREEDVVGRYGGDEFCIILPHTTGEDAITAIERVRKALMEKTFVSDEGRTFNVTGSFGVAEISQSDSLDALISKADDALYKSKKNGRNCVTLYKSKLD